MTPEQKAINCPNGITATNTLPTTGRTLACEASLKGKWVDVLGIGKRKCEDRGGDITEGRIDVYMDTYEEAMSFGKQRLTMVVL